MTLHPELAAGRWSMVSLCEQLAHIGSEVDRAICAAQAGRRERAQKALERALDLFGLNTMDERWRGHRRRGICRAREDFLALFYGGTMDPAPADATRRLSSRISALATPGANHLPRAFTAK